MRAWTWMATLAVEVSFLPFRLDTSVCVKRPHSSEAFTYSSLLAGVLIGAARIVTHPFVPLVCLIRSRLDVENANCAAGSPPAWLVWIASGRANATARKAEYSCFFLSLILSCFRLEGRSPSARLRERPTNFPGALAANCTTLRTVPQPRTVR